jgi:biotin synthesis protein BioG
MKTFWLNQQNNQDCILFMAGWGMAPEPFLDIASGPVDVLMVYDYRTIDEDECDLPTLPSSTNSQRKIHLLAWSMGVWAAAKLVRNGTLPCRSFSSATAVGGTCQPVHDQFGIPEQMFDRTVRDFSPEVLEEFYRSMFDSDQEEEQFLRHMAKTKRSVEELRQELIALRTACEDLPDVSEELADVFKNRIVTGRDRVFPARNQMRAWGRKTCASVPLPHFPFYQWSSWAEIFKILQRPCHAEN